jgi:hypothetical protein
LKITSRALDAKQVRWVCSSSLPPENPLRSPGHPCSLDTLLQAGGSTKRADTALVVPEGASLQKICRFNGLSYLMPLRKKLHMQLFADALHLNNADTDAPELRVTYDQVRHGAARDLPWSLLATDARD